VDYLSGEDDYKKNWMSERREFWGIAAFNPRSVRGLMQIGQQIGGRAVKNAAGKAKEHMANWKKSAGFAPATSAPSVDRLRQS
jgi:hypothetical protein